MYTLYPLNIEPFFILIEKAGRRKTPFLLPASFSTTLPAVSPVLPLTIGLTQAKLLEIAPLLRCNRKTKGFKAMDVGTFSRIGLIEQTGRGVDKIFMGQLRYGRPAPDYSRSDASGVRVVLHGGEPSLQFAAFVYEQDNGGTTLSLDELMVLNALFMERHIDSESAGNLIQKGTSAGKAVLERLHERGLIEARGDKRARDYHLSAPLYRRFQMKAEYVRAKGFEPAQIEQMILNYAREHGKITRSEAADLCHLSVFQASRILRQLNKKHKQIQIVGKGRGANYVWKEGKK